MALTKLWDGAFNVTAPVVAGGSVYVAATATGQIHRLGGDGALSMILETNGGPVGMATDPTNGDVYIADNGRQALVKMELDDASGTGVLAPFLDTFEGKPFRGPHGVAFDAAGEMYFTDPGAFGDTGLTNPRGAVYRTVQNRQQVVTLAPPSLAAPTGVACGPNGCVYVAELHANRVLRFAQRPAGVFHASVFVQLAGGVGPSAVAVHPKTGDVYVAKYDFAPGAGSAGAAPTGQVVVFTETGEEKGSIVVPGPEVSGLCFDATGATLYITEQHAIYSCAVGAA